MKDFKNKVAPIIALVVLCMLILTMAILGEKSSIESGEIAKVPENKVKTIEMEEENSTNKTEKEPEYKFVETAELILDTTDLGVKNSYYSAFLNSYMNDDATVSFNIDTDMPIDSYYYEIVDENGDIVHTDRLGLSMGSSGNNNYQFALTKFAFVNEEETHLKPEWQFLGFRFHILSGLDTSIIIEPTIFNR